MEPTTRLELEGLGKDYPGVPGALRDFSLSIEPGELVKILKLFLH